MILDVSVLTGFQQIPFPGQSFQHILLQNIKSLLRKSELVTILL